ncbi:DUF7504 family protein [Haloarchaeobius sp. TZWWS8]|uniref:DUF7504 family protein n=1 Tax=Haloarchaeobius sp. TZWWS8 TaxID=3446121 RepID=UPI003EC08C49
MTDSGRARSHRCTLLLDETTDDEAGEHCDRLMTVCEAARRAELVVTFAKDVTDSLDLGALSSGRQPAKRGVITVGETMRTVTTGDPDFSEPIVETAITDPSDLQGLGRRISQFCQVWRGAGYELSVCFDSLTALLEANDPEIVFQFCHVLAGRLRSAGATAHFHLDPNAHGQRLQLTFEQIFDQTLHEEIDIEQLVPTRRSRASDRDVARGTAALDLDDPANETESGTATPAAVEAGAEDVADGQNGGAGDSSTQNSGGGDSTAGEASDEDIANALPD